ncbi:DASH complex subunit Dam1 domain-containing protein [Trichoderma longibrachiatum]
MAPPIAPDVHQSGGRHPDPRTWASRPTTPLRPPSQSSCRGSLHATGDGDAAFPLKRLEPMFAELSDAMADLEANMMHFQLIDESLARFGESFASFLYGLNMNAFCVDFPEVLLPLAAHMCLFMRIDLIHIYLSYLVPRTPVISSRPPAPQ